MRGETQVRKRVPSTKGATCKTHEPMGISKGNVDECTMTKTMFQDTYNQPQTIRVRVTKTAFQKVRERPKITAIIALTKHK